jgi:hypothetical protein
VGINDGDPCVGKALIDGRRKTCRVAVDNIERWSPRGSSPRKAENQWNCFAA